jgi:hypothetical protein
MSLERECVVGGRGGRGEGDGGGRNGKEMRRGEGKEGK